MPDGTGRGSPIKVIHLQQHQGIPADSRQQEPDTPLQVQPVSHSFSGRQKAFPGCMTLAADTDSGIEACVEWKEAIENVISSGHVRDADRFAVTHR